MIAANYFMQFIEGDVAEDDVSDDEHESELCQTNIKGFDLLHLDQVCSSGVFDIIFWFMWSDTQFFMPAPN